MIFALILEQNYNENYVGLRTLNERIHLLIALPIFCSPWGVVEFGSQSTLPADWAFVVPASLHRYQHLAVITPHTEQVTTEGCQCLCRE